MPKEKPKLETLPADRRIMRMIFVLMAILLGIGFTSFAAYAGIEAEFEASLVMASRNDVRIPGKGGTKFSLIDDLSSSPGPAFRLRLGYRFSERHRISALYAPLLINARGSIDREVIFNGATYPAASPLLAVYRFDSYRLNYRYSFIKVEGLELAAGFTAKIRDAETSLYGLQSSRKTNTGFVPLLHVHITWRPYNAPFGFVFDADALAAPQGRAEDILLAATWSLRQDLELRIGYRMVEGGADNDEVYSFAWFHYAVIGFGLRI